MGIKQLWAPWRMEFLTSPDDKKPKGCVFCTLPKDSDDKRSLIVHRGKNAFVILNKFPYNNGHLMVVPFQHTAAMEDLNEETLAEIMRLSKFSISALRKAYSPEGFNVGMNLGVSGGAGIKDHLHMHVVPRWLGDTNFMPILADTKAMPQHLEASFDQLRPWFEKG